VVAVAAASTFRQAREAMLVVAAAVLAAAVVVYRVALVAVGQARIQAVADMRAIDLGHHHRIVDLVAQDLVVPVAVPGVVVAV
jgi:hypothetical protein